MIRGTNLHPKLLSFSFAQNLSKLIPKSVINDEEVERGGGERGRDNVCVCVISLRSPAQMRWANLGRGTATNLAWRTSPCPWTFSVWKFGKPVKENKNHEIEIVYEGIQAQLETESPKQKSFIYVMQIMKKRNNFWKSNCTSIVQKHLPIIGFNKTKTWQQ